MGYRGKGDGPVRGVEYLNDARDPRRRTKGVSATQQKRGPELGWPHEGRNWGGSTKKT